MSGPEVNLFGGNEYTRVGKIATDFSSLYEFLKVSCGLVQFDEPANYNYDFPTVSGGKKSTSSVATSTLGSVKSIADFSSLYESLK